MSVRRVHLASLIIFAGAAAAAVLLVAPAPAAAEIERYAVLIGNNLGDRDEVELRYAEDDAEKVYEVLRNLGGFRSENMVLLRGSSATEVRQALIHLNGRIRRRTRPGGPSTMLMVYYSGHADAR
ncbi:MAG: caspase family protein, partial [Myxococcota bacterium]